MVNPKCLRSSHLWVAAYCSKQLKKAQVFDTDIPSSVDKILQAEMDAVSYRVLAYLLLGVVRIYSKKVEYLLHDCNEVLIQIKKFVINTKDNAQVETLRMSITIPDRFELDAFDLDILEEAGGGHIAPPEEITLKDVLCKTEEFGQFSLDKFEEFDFCQNDCSADHCMVEDVRLSHLMDMDFEVFPSYSPVNLLEGKDVFQNNIFSQKEPMSLDTDLVVEGVEKESVNLCGQDQQINDDQTIQETVPYEDEIHEERSRISQEESVGIIRFSGREKEPVLSVKALNESHQVDEEQIMALETSRSSCPMHQEIKEVHETVPYEDELHEERTRISQGEFVEVSRFSGREKESMLSVNAFNEYHQVDEEQIMEVEMSSSSCQMHQKIREIHEARSFQEKMEKPQDDNSCQKDCLDHGKSSDAKENLEELFEGSVEEHDYKGKLEFQEKVSLEDGKFSVIKVQSKNLDVTPQSKFQGGSVGKQNPGATTPEFMLISTPATRECSRFSRKRKCVVDAVIVVPNEVLRKNIHDASDLVSKRGKFRRTLLAVQRQSHISSLPDGFYESLLPCYSLELRSLFSKRKMKISNSLEIVDTLGKLDVSEPQTVSSPEHVTTAPQTHPECPDFLELVETPLKLDASEFETVGSPEHIASAPHTPPQCPKSKVRPIELAETSKIKNSDNLGPSSPHESIEREQSLKRDKELNLMEEEINSCEPENSELLAGWSNRTRNVARFLHKRFLDLKKLKEEEVVNFSQVLGGRVKKECARLFYELLVLKTTSYVDVKQKNAHGDIAIRNLPKLDHSFDIDDL